MSKRVGVIGCGWFGLPLAKALVEEGHVVHGTTTSKEKMELLDGAGIVPFQISLSENGILGSIGDFLNGMKILVVNVPPRLRGDHKEDYTKKMDLLKEAIHTSTIEKIIFVSSTSVYGDIEGEVTERSLPNPQTASGKQLLFSEQLFAQANNIQTTILRFGGLIGPNRHPITRLSGKKGLPNGNAPLNLIHLNDCIAIVQFILRKGYWNETFNAVYPYHPSKEEYYTAQALKKGLAPPEYRLENDAHGKKIVSERLINVKNYQFMTSITD